MMIRLLENAKTDSSVALTRLTDLGFYTELPIVNLVTAITAGNRHETKNNSKNWRGPMWNILKNAQEIFALTLAVGTLLALASVIPA